MKNLFTKIVAVIVVGLFGIVFFPTPKVQAFSGSGTGIDQNDPFVITTCAQLQEMGDDLDAPYVLGNDIDCSASAGWNNLSGFRPVGDENINFTGRLEGYNHTISNLTINRPAEDYVGLFGYMGPVSSILNTRLKNVTIVGDEYVGAVTGATTNGDILGVSADGTVNGTAWTGGLAGLLTGTIINGYTNVEVTSNNAPSGGLVGKSTGIIFMSYSRGLVSSTGTAHGGLVGVNNGDPIIDSFWDIETSNQSVSDGGTGKTSDEMKDIATYTDVDTVGLDNPWDFNNSWGIDPLLNSGYPYIQNFISGVPDTSITSTPSNPSDNSESTFVFTSSEPLSTFECKIEPLENTYSPCTSSHATAALADGTYVFSVRAVNIDGIADQTPATYSWTIVADTDGDSVIDSIENARPNNGDANNDGILDSLQSNVFSFMSADNKLTVAALDSGCEFISGGVINENNLSVQDVNFDYPSGLLDFTGFCNDPTVTTGVNLYLYDEPTEGPNKSIRKYDPNTEKFGDIDSQRGSLIIDGHPVGLGSYTIADGYNDTDGDPSNGQFTDPIGLAVAVNRQINNSSSSSDNGSLAGTGQDITLILGAASILTLLASLATIKQHFRSIT